MKRLFEKKIRTLLIAAAMALPAAAHATNIVVPPVPDAVKVTATEGVVFFVGHATGTQNYVCLPTATGFGFVLFTPEATLFNDDGDQQLITHYFSPNPFEHNTNPALSAIGPIRATWQHSRDGSFVWAAVNAGNASTDANFVDSNAIAWLKVTAKGTQDGPDGGDILSKTVFIQRLNTHGGLAPADRCTSQADVGHLAFVPYTADYFFYQKPDAN